MADIRPVLKEHLPSLAWTGDSLHLEYVEKCLDKPATLELYSLWVEGRPIAFGGINFSDEPHSAYIWMLATHPAHQGKGRMQELMAFLERRILERGAPLAKLAVETDNARAIRLYEFLGYRYHHDETQSWFEEGEDGTPRIYTANCYAYQKELV